jgi:hypothetical protein
MRVFLSTTLLLFTTAAFAFAQEPVIWINETNVTLRGARLQKTGGCDGCDDAGATSRQVIRSGDGAVEFRVGEAYTFWIAGLSRSDGRSQFSNIDFAVRLNGNGWADVMENGTYVGGDTQYVAGDAFRIELVGGRIRYIRNGEVMYTSQKRPVYPLAFDVAFGSAGASLAGARIDTRDRAVATAGLEDQFLRLDRNDDGLVSRPEWGRFRGGFNQRDSNRDGLISRLEYGLNDGEYPVGTAGSGDFIIVSGTERWTDTGLTLRVGDRVTFDAQGTVQMSPDPSDTADPAGSQRLAPDAPLRTRAAGSLIARIGESAPILIGARRTFSAPGSGRLYLSVNDDYLGDNSGEYRVLVTIDPR